LESKDIPARSAVLQELIWVGEQIIGRFTSSG